MPLDTAAILAEIDDALAAYEKVETEHSRPYHNPEWGAIEGEDFIAAPEIVSAEIITSLRATIDRFGPPGYGEKVLAAVPGDDWESKLIRTLAGILRSLRADYAAGRMRTLKERLHADMFSDFLEMAEYFIEDGFKDPAAVMAGGVLEEHLRKLCEKNNLSEPDRPKLDTMNADLAKQGAYGKNDQKQVTAWAGIRNSAAHGNYGQYDFQQVKHMVAGIRSFITRNPA